MLGEISTEAGKIRVKARLSDDISEIMPYIEDYSVGQDCIYYFKEQYEEGELLTPQQHLLLQDQDKRSKKMQGPMR